VIDSAGAIIRAFCIFERGSDDAFLVAVWMDTGAPHEAGEEVSISIYNCLLASVSSAWSLLTHILVCMHLCSGVKVLYSNGNDLGIAAQADVALVIVGFRYAHIFRRELTYTCHLGHTG
jgi:hypothetical protein